MPNRNNDDLQGELNRSPLSGAYGQEPRAEVWQRIRRNVLGLSLLFAAMFGLGSLALLFVGGGVFLGVAGALLMAGAAVGAIRGYRRREWPWSLGALAVEVAWFAVLTVLLN
ncbi:hypothetical protein ACFOZ0_04430 [Streptomyces yaanensis]|uniref:Uncharacterized protein n=1 Tax=Streptomyces yaanensis TaxID=1142239 RepID=A0ABV7S8D1_9ACTN|nr:hypothetical protein [Streptomyces sp. CGMCC 4.7035]WNC00105.1 hypothetical protein Q2K21_19650 [Streptomyces sp. CGMCC 4.7035]